MAGGQLTNSMLSTASGEIGSSWQTWSPTFTNFTLGNGTIDAAYIKIGKLVHYRLHITLGSTSSISAGGVKFSLPVTSKTLTMYRDVIGIGLIDDTGVGNYLAIVLQMSATLAQLFSISAAGAYGILGGFDPSSPFTFGNGDSVQINGSFEAA